MNMIYVKKRYIITALTVVAILIGGGVHHKIKHRITYETKELNRCTITQAVEASGTINPVNTVSVGSTVSGLIRAIYVDYNSVVKKGQLLAEIDPRTFEATVQQNAAQIASAEADLAKVQAETAMSLKTYNRYKNLYRKNFIAKSELDQAESDYLANVAQVNSAKAKINQYRATYKTAQTNLSYTKITAPVNGTIISREIDLGQPVAASFQAPELFTIAQDLTKMQIEVNVSEADIGNVQEGQDVTYTLDGYPDSIFTGKVTQVRISPTTVSNVVTYSVIVAVDNEDLKLKPGMTANVSIITHESKDVLCVPTIALKYTPEVNGQKYKSQGMWVLVKNKPQRVEISTGASDDNNIEVSGRGLKEGQKVIIGSSNIVKREKGKQQRRKPPGMF